MSNRWKGTLAKRTKLKIFPKQNKHGRQNFLLNSTSREVRPAPSGDYVLLSLSGDYNQTILGISFSRTFKNIAINSRTFKGT